VRPRLAGNTAGSGRGPWPGPKLSRSSCRMPTSGPSVFRR